MKILFFCIIAIALSCTNQESESFLKDSLIGQNQEISDTTVQKYYDNGNLKEVFSLKNGVLHGHYQSFYQNGSISLRGSYDSGRFVGKWEYINKNEHLDSITEYTIVGSKSEINQKWVFSKKGEIILDKSFYYTTEFYEDTVELGTFNSLLLLLEQPYYGHQMAILLGDFDQKFSNMEEIEVDSLWLPKYGFQYNFVSYKPGKNVVRLIAVDLDISGNAKYFFIEEEFFVSAEYRNGKKSQQEN